MVFLSYSECEGAVLIIIRIGFISKRALDIEGNRFVAVDF